MKNTAKIRPLWPTFRKKVKKTTEVHWEAISNHKITWVA